MDRSRFTLLLIILLLLAGCRQQDERIPETPTPFSSVGTTARAPVGEPIAITLANLAANPGLFEGANLQLRGMYQPQARLICEQDAYPSPATWGLVGEGLLANATGHDTQLRELIDIGQEIIVEGRWLRYSGPVGCGKSATEQEIWYLSTSRIVDPHPLARSGQAVSAAPPEVTVIVEQPITATAVSGEELTEVVETATLEQTETVGATFIPPATTPTQTTAPTQVTQPAVTETPVPPARATLTPSPTITVSVATPAQTGTATVTPTITNTPLADSATPESGTETPTATATTVNNQDPEFKGDLDFEDLIMGKLTAGSVDIWAVTMDSSEALTITVAPASTANIVLSVVDANDQTVVDRQDDSAAGGVETIRNLSVTNGGSIRVHVASDPEQVTDYALMVMDESSYSFIFMGTLDPESQRSGTLEAENDHFWFFNATDGDTLSMLVTPNGETDAYVELYGPDSTRLLTIDDVDRGEAESLENHSILASGLYAIRVGEFDFEPMIYQIVVDFS